MFRFHVPNMTCGGCAKSVTKALLNVDPTANVETDPPTHEVRVRSSAAEAQLVAALEAAGFPAERRSDYLAG